MEQIQEQWNIYKCVSAFQNNLYKKQSTRTKNHIGRKGNIRLLTLEALRRGGGQIDPPRFFWLYIFAPGPIVKSFGTTVPCL